MKRLIVFFVLSISVTAVFFQKANGDATKVRRITLIVGSNYGGPGRDKLRYAVSDARSFARVLNQMGGVNKSDTSILVEPDRDAFNKALVELRKNVLKAKKTSGRVEIIFYYSGHSDEEGLLLGKQKLSYHRLRDTIKDIPADVRIAILDSCSSGAFTRFKGGTMQPPFMVDSSYNMKGYAFLTSSSSNEASQESDRIGGSFFTHYLLSGLKGAADTNNDRRITLTESYQYAFHETLARTEKAYGGPQHPNYHIKMTGTGDVIMTDIRKGASRLVLAGPLYGRISIRDRYNSQVAELNKVPGKDINLALESGEYRIVNERDEGVYVAKVSLDKAGGSIVRPGSFSPVDRERYIKRGGGGEYTIIPFSTSLLPLQKSNNKITHNWALNLLGDYCTRLDGASVGLGISIVEEDARFLMINLISNYVGNDLSGAQLSLIMNYVGGDAKYLQASSVFNYVGGSAAYIQAAAVFNWTKESFRGVQASSVLNWTGKDFHGVQASSVFNYAGEITGLQASIANLAGPVKGSQLGLVNVAGNTKGMQLGLVNAAKDVDGVQLGLVNISREMNGVPIGLINVSRNGGIDLLSWGSNLTAVNAGIRFRAGRVYTIFSTGGMNLSRDGSVKDSVATSFYAGFRLDGPILSFIDPDICYLDLDVGIVNIDNKDLFEEQGSEDQFAFQGRIIAGIRVLKHLSLFAGGGTSYIFHEDFVVSDGSWKPLFLGGAALEF